MSSEPMPMADFNLPSSPSPACVQLPIQALDTLLTSLLAKLGIFGALRRAGILTQGDCRCKCQMHAEMQCTSCV